MTNGGSGIKHFIVLMLENRSFDHMLGYLEEVIPAIDGLVPKPSKPSLDCTGTDDLPVKPFKTTGIDADYFTKPDPSHEFPDVGFQMYGDNNPNYEATPTMKGFVKCYAVQKANGPSIMKCFRPEDIPVLSNLAKNFTIFDRWFSSVPGPTWPNRFYVHAATSKGWAISPSHPTVLESFTPLSPWDMRTIYDDLAAAKSPLSWKIYYHDSFQSGALKNQHGSSYIQKFDWFKIDIQHDQLPTYSFIEPNYAVNDLAANANSQHPPYDVRAGERLIADVFKTLTSKERIWNSCALLIVYDEHGGFYDHVPPPVAVPPGDAISTNPSFSFNRLGVRVPSVLVSPYVKRGDVVHTVFDHSSVPATIRKMFGLSAPKLTNREAAADTFENVFQNAIITDINQARRLADNITTFF